MSSFLVDGKMISDKNDILNKWADHFETLGTPSDNVTYDKSFFQKVSCRVKELFSILSVNLKGILSEPLSYEEVDNICDKLKQGVTGFLFSYAQGDNSHKLGYGMCHYLRVLFWLKNKFLGLFCSF